MPRFMVKEKLYKKAVAVSEKLDLPPEEVVEQALKKGLALMKKTSSVSRKKEDVFIKENWQKMGDGEIAQHLGLTRVQARYRRLSLGLKRKKTRKKARINPKWLENILTHGGLTQTDVARQFGISRERVSQLVNDLGGAKEKSPLWYANRHSRPELADKEWLEAALKKENGASPLSQKMKISVYTIKDQAERLGIDSALVYSRPEVVQKICSGCGEPFERRKSFIKPSQKYFFCRRSCHGKWLSRQSPYWPSDKLEFLKSNWQKMNDRQLAGELGISREAVGARRRILRLMRFKRVSPHEETF